MNNQLPDYSQELPSITRLRALTAATNGQAFRVGIVIGPGFIPMDIVGIQAVFGMVPEVEIHLLWKTRDAVEGFPNWWTLPTRTFAECPETLDVLAVPMLASEAQFDPEVLAFIAERGARAQYLIGICYGAVALGAAGFLKGRRATTNFNALSMLESTGVREVVPSGNGVVVDGNVYTAGPGLGSFEAALQVVGAAFGTQAAQLAELFVEYDAHPPFGTGTPQAAGPELLGMAQVMLGEMVAGFRERLAGVPA